MAARKRTARPARTKATRSAASKPRPAAKKTPAKPAKARRSPKPRPAAKTVRTVNADTLRDDVRRMSVEAFCDGQFSSGRISTLVNDVFDGAVQNVDRSIPSTRSNVLRQVFDGLGDGVRAVAAAGSDTIRETGERARRTVNAAGADRRVRAADRDFLSAVRNFADRASIEVQQELDSLVARAQRMGPKVSQAVRHAGEAASGNWGELSEESVRAGGRMAKNAVGALAATLSGFFQGLDEAANAPRKPGAPRHKR